MVGTLGRLFDVIDAEGEEARQKAIGNLEEHHRELIETSAANATYLVKEEVYKKIIDGADKVRCMRDVLKETTFQMPTPNYRLILHENVFRILPVVPPTAEYPVAPNESYRPVQFVALKYGQIPVIEQELIEDSMFDIVEMRLKDIGKVAENTLNQKCIDQIIANATGNISYHHNYPVECVARAIRDMKKHGFNPDSLVMTATMEGDLFNDPNFRYEYSGETGNFRTQELGKKIMGLKPYILTVNSSNASFGNTIKGVVLDSTKACGLGIRDDITVTKFEDPRNDLLNLKVGMRFDTKYFFKSAIINLSGDA
jgi:hypothetical protein